MHTREMHSSYLSRNTEHAKTAYDQHGRHCDGVGVDERRDERQERVDHRSAEPCFELVGHNLTSTFKTYTIAFPWSLGRVRSAPLRANDGSGTGRQTKKYQQRAPSRLHPRQGLRRLTSTYWKSLACSACGVVRATKRVS